MLQLLDVLVLCGNDPVDKVSERQYTSQISIAIDNGQMANPVLRHYLHGVMNSGTAIYRDWRMGHDLVDKRIL